VEDIAEESREEENYENLRKRLSVPVTVQVQLHNAGRGRRIGAGCLRNKRARASMHLLQLAIQSIQMLAKSLKQVQQRLHHLQRGAAAASETSPTPPASAQVAAGPRPGSPVRWRIRMKHW